MKRILCAALALTLCLTAFAAAEETNTARSVFRLLQSGDYEAVYALFDASMQAAMPVRDFHAILPFLEDDFGEPVRFGIETESFEAGFRLTVLPVYYRDNVVIFQVNWKDNQIAGMFQGTIPTEKASSGEIPEGVREDGLCLGNPPSFGLLTLPENASGPLPAVVLLHGSGPADMDEAVGNTKMFRDLALGFAQNGIATLRFYKRTYIYASEYSPENLRLFTVREESINDAVAASQILRADPRIDPNGIYLVGHSMGAMIAPRIAQEYPGLFDGIILLSGTPKTLGDIVLSQNQAVVDALPALKKAIGTIQMQGLRKEWADLLNSTEEEAKNKNVFGQPAYYFWEMARYDAGEILENLDIPVLIINGGRDFQVVDADGIEAWNALNLPDSVQVIYHPELNHLLMAPDAPEEARGTTAEYDTPCHVSPDVIEEMARFMLH